jgi:lipopolysaccharide transport system permease protein
MQGANPTAVERAASAVPRANSSSSDRPSGVSRVVEELVIRPRSGWVEVNWGELYRNRETLYFLTSRDIKIRYKQTVLGVAWAVIQPLMMMMIFTFIFGRFAKIPSEGLPYPVFVFAGLIPWTLFSNGMNQGALSLVSQQQMVTKVYLPRLYLPAAAVGVFLVDLCVSFVLYGLILAWYGVVPSRGVVLLPVLVLLTVMLTLGFAFFLSALTALYRDFRFVVPFMVQILMYVSPIIYPATLLPRRYQAILSLNPLVGLIEGYRSAILGTPWHWGLLAISAAMTLAIFLFGLYYFRRAERRMADVI